MSWLKAFLAEVARIAAKTLLPAWLIAAEDLTTHGGSHWADRRDRSSLGQFSRPENLAADGIVLGWLDQEVLQSPREDNVLMFGVQRSGKTSTVVVPTLLGWSGAAIATSTKEELVRLTSAHRRRRGPVWVFAPLDRDHAWLEPLGLAPATWNPVADTFSCGEAAELADHFTAQGKRGDSAHWYLSAGNLLTGLIAFAREQDGDMRTVLSLINRTSLSEYLELARVTEDRTAADLLFAIGQTPEKEAGSVASTARSAISLWIDERVALATGSSDHELDLDQLLTDGGTLYLVAPAEEAERCRPLFSALLTTLLRKATSRARELGGVLKPRLLVALDEAANFARVPRLAGYASSGPGQGIQLLLCYHDLAQLEAAYGSEQSRTVWNNCRARLLLPGQGDLKTLDYFSRAIGNETRIFRTLTRDRNHTSQSEQRTGRPLMTVDELRRLSSAVLVYANAPPARLGLRRWDQVPAWRRLIEPDSDPR
jgi:type IV secretion system protein VirD4